MEDPMDDTLDTLLGFAPDYDAPIPYMRRTREYYAAIGYTTPYRWAHHIEAPFTHLRKPLREARLISSHSPSFACLELTVLPHSRGRLWSLENIDKRLGDIVLPSRDLLNV